MKPFVSVIVPCYNEASHIDGLLESIAAQDYPADRIEILVAEGGSTDGTRERLGEWHARMPALRVLDNPGRYVSPGLNACIRASRGDVVVRMDVHAHYPAGYIRVLVDRLQELGADNTGGVLDTEPADPSPEARAIAIAMAHPLGVGNAAFRTGLASESKQDTVPFGCFRRDIFDRIGYFDEELIRNQDDEFNARIIRNGGSVWLIPSVRVRYYARPTRKLLRRMQYQYGLFKPLVNRKIGAPATLRQFAPPLLVLSAAVVLAAAFVHPPWIGGVAVWSLMYSVPVLMISFRLAQAHGWALFFHLCVTFPSIHFSYGAGYLAGLVRWNLFRRRALIPPDVNDSR